MIDLIKKILSSSIVNLFNNQPNILTHTSQTTMTEWNLAHHLTNEITKYLFWLDHDVEVVKRSYSERPDIIFHKRGINTLNFLVIEIKRLGNTKGDIRKIKEDWMQGDLRYRFGASVVVRSKANWTVSVFERDDPEPLYLNHRTFTQQLPIPLLTLRNKPIVEKIEALVHEILSITQGNDYLQNSEKQVKVKELESEIDRRAYELYELTPEEIGIVEGNYVR